MNTQTNNGREITPEESIEESTEESTEDSQETSLTKLANGIREHLIKFKTYTFRPIRIDGIYCYPVIHRKTQIVNFESINIICEVTTKDRIRKFQKYSLLHKKYKTIESAILFIERVVSTYKVYNGDLVNSRDFELLKLEEKFVPYEDNQKCCVCLENTQEITTCNHYICLHCREQCISSQKIDCPMCRKSGIIRIFNIDNKMINNVEYEIVRNSIDYEQSITESSSELSTSDDDEADDDHEEYDHEVANSSIYQFPGFATPHIFAYTSNDALDDIFTFPLLNLTDRRT